MSDRAARIAKLSLEQRRLLERMLQERAQARTDEGIPVLPRYSESGQPAVFPLSSEQRHMWFAQQAQRNLGTRAKRLRGPLEVSALEASLREICVRHEALRTTFGTRDGEPVQIVGPPQPVSLTQIDLRELSPPAREAEAARLLAREARRPLDLSRDMMLRVTLLRLHDQEHVLLSVMPHIVSDGWSEDVLFDELSTLYNASRSGSRASLPELPVQYVDYVVWKGQRLQDGALRPVMEYWKKQLADAPTILNMPVDGHRPLVRTSAGMRQELRVPDSLTQELHALCRGQNVTLFMTLLAGWATLLHRYSREDDIVIGTPFANRNQPEVDGLIGFFGNLLVLRHDLSGDPSFAELLGRVRKTAIDAFSHGELPLEKLKELCPKFQAGFELRNTINSGPKLDGLQVEPVEIDRSVSVKLVKLIMIKGDDGLTARVDYNADLYESATIARMLGHFRTLLENIVADPKQRLSELLLLTEAELPADTYATVRRRGRPASSAQPGGWQARRFAKWLRRAARFARRAAGRYLGRGSA